MFHLHGEHDEDVSESLVVSLEEAGETGVESIQLFELLQFIGELGLDAEGQVAEHGEPFQV